MFRWERMKPKVRNWARSTPLLWALALPPRYQDLNWETQENYQAVNKNYQVKKARNHYFLTRQDVGHAGLAYLEGNNIVVPDAEGKLSYFNTSLRQPQSSARQIANSKYREMFQRKDLSTLSHERGRYDLFLEDGVLLYFPTKSSRENLWKIELGQNLVGVKQRGSSSDLWMWSYENPKLMFLSWGTGREANRSTLHKIKWKEDSLPMFLNYCGNREVTFLERDDAGVFKLHQLFEMNLSGPIPKLTINLSEILPPKVGSQSAEVYQVLVSSCQKTFLIGNFGILGVEY